MVARNAGRPRSRIVGCAQAYCAICAASGSSIVVLAPLILRGGRNRRS